jgi:hypothetical protein
VKDFSFNFHAKNFNSGQVHGDVASLSVVSSTCLDFSSSISNSIFSGSSYLGRNYCLGTSLTSLK